MRRYALRDDQWDRIKDILPGREGHVGGTAADNRLFVEAVLFRFRAGIPWRDLPERFGDWKIVYQRFNRWPKSGVFERVFKLLASDHDNEYMMIGTEPVQRLRSSLIVTLVGKISQSLNGLTRSLKLRVYFPGTRAQPKIVSDMRRTTVRPTSTRESAGSRQHSGDGKPGATGGVSGTDGVPQGSFGL
jgi:transposase